MTKREKGLVRTSVQVVQDYLRVADEAKRNYEDVVEREYPEGSYVFYTHGFHERSGRVEGHSCDRIQIRSRSGSRIWLDASRVKRVAK